MNMVERAQHHAQELEISIPYLAGFVAGLASEKPSTWKSTVFCPFMGKNIVIRPYSILEKNDSIEIFISRSSQFGKIIVNQSFFRKTTLDITIGLIEIKNLIEKLSNNQQINEVIYS